MAKGLFITGSDTGVGKSYIGAQFSHYLFRQKVPVQPRKPLESGCQLTSNGLWPSDGAAYADAVENTIPVDTITPYRFAASVAPPRAMAMANVDSVTTQQAVNAIYKDTDVDSFLLVEGAGGFYSPLTADGLNVDLASVLQLPVLIIVADRLGCLNHVLLTIAAIKNAQLQIAAIIMNACPSSEAVPSNYEDLRQLTTHEVFYCTHKANPVSVYENLYQRLYK